MNVVQATAHRQRILVPTLRLEASRSMTARQCVASDSAPTGHTLTHWPQLMHALTLMSESAFPSHESCVQCVYVKPFNSLCHTHSAADHGSRASEATYSSRTTTLCPHVPRRAQCSLTAHEANVALAPARKPAQDVHLLHILRLIGGNNIIVVCMPEDLPSFLCPMYVAVSQSGGCSHTHLADLHAAAALDALFTVYGDGRRRL